MNFDLTGWRSVLPAPTRSRAEALALANHLALLAQREPNRFGELAGRYSEDLTTRDRGGSLGGVSADQYMRWPVVLDALAAMNPGQVSRVVETEYGFHVLYRSPPPPATSAAGAHIVIAHDDAPWIRFVARGPIPRRSRADATDLAARLYEVLRSNPGRFNELVSQHSEHRDAMRGGDFGTWPSHAPTPFTREVEALHSLSIEEVARPLDTRIGIQIIRRLPDVDRREYAMAAIRLRYSPSAPPEHPESRAQASARMAAMLKRVNAEPTLFDALRKETCCPFVERWEDGRGSPALATLLDRLAPGDVAREVVETDFSFVIAQRRVPAPPSWPNTVYSLPNSLGQVGAQTASAHEHAPVPCAQSQTWIEREE